MPAIIGRSGLPKSALYTKMRKVPPVLLQWWYKYITGCQTTGGAKHTGLLRSGKPAP